MFQNLKLIPVILAFFIIGCTQNTPVESVSVSKPDWSSNPWPEIRKQRISQLLPEAMKAAQVDCWLTICRENNNDPLAIHVGGENAGGTAAFLFYIDDSGFHSLVFSPDGEATALDELDIHDEVVRVPRGTSAVAQAAEIIKTKNFQQIAINSSTSNSLADGMSFSQRQELESLLGETSSKLVSATELVYEWLSIKLPAEVEIMRQAAQLASDFQYEAYAMIEPGKTTDADVAKFLKAKMAQYGVTDAWHPDQNPNVNSGPDRGHSHATDKIIMPGDVIQIDFGVKLYDIWVSDIQRFAYVLKEGESEAPADIQQYWEHGKAGSRAALAAMKPGVKGVEVDRAQRELMEKAGSEYVMWSTGHPVGYVAHDVGPNLGGSQAPSIRPAAQKELKKGMVFAFDGFHAWKRADGTTKTISVEEMAVVTENGAEYLIQPQEELILVK
ncbi:M24 family metallopeptidase [Algoriphagus sp. CAU 1675]|uniref:M24 family metallopeptidase n=1 Tax=Algoriphagus sp. CAU 1675 TaxID=3032597 RepID=UPI0023DA1670|nr:M24 family metallopeptidase [Algoriphagus sp. CAU 1675]MDF2158758.1 M24 family metallopeptidase [Algoriphagus sp. CAU 1675]